MDWEEYSDEEGRWGFGVVEIHAYNFAMIKEYL